MYSLAKWFKTQFQWKCNYVGGGCFQIYIFGLDKFFLFYVYCIYVLRSMSYDMVLFVIPIIQFVMGSIRIIGSERKEYEIGYTQKCLFGVHCGIQNGYFTWAARAPSNSSDQNSIKPLPTLKSRSTLQWTNAYYGNGLYWTIFHMNS